MFECLSLRHRVYNLMGYLDEEMSSNSIIELDMFDKSGLHFVATEHPDGPIVGTMRLVFAKLPRLVTDSVVGTSPHEINRRQQRLFDGAIVQAKSESLRARYHQWSPVPFPIFHNTNFLEKCPEFPRTALKSRKGVELGRLVVEPDRRGKGIAGMLIRTGIATAFNVGMSYIVLECIPAHVSMYKKYGFRVMQGHHVRERILDQVAIGMKLELDDFPLNPPLVLAKDDIKMIGRGHRDPHMLFGSKCLCLCHQHKCDWKSGKYQLRGAPQCPLRDRFKASITAPATCDHSE
jgi:predicted GNAT family N-acyltransferase